MWKEYIEYINDNPKGYWFRRKIYGYGWTPATWQGWMVMLVFVFAIAFNISRFAVLARLESQNVLGISIRTLLLVFILLAICYLKGEPPKWQWGLPPREVNAPKKGGK